MKTKDRLKEEIGLDKLLMTILSAIASSMVGWLFNAEPSLKAVLVLLIAVAFLLATLFFLFQIKIKIKELDL